jgi:hypothetical protein
LFFLRKLAIFGRFYQGEDPLLCQVRYFEFHHFLGVLVSNEINNFGSRRCFYHLSIVLSFRFSKVAVIQSYK